jgi:hypothetical protein
MQSPDVALHDRLSSVVFVFVFWQAWPVTPPMEHSTEVNVSIWHGNSNTYENHNTVTNKKKDGLIDR